MTRYETNDDAVVVSESSPVYTTYTSGTRDPLYSGDSAYQAAQSLEMSDEEFNGLLMSDAVEQVVA